MHLAASIVLVDFRRLTPCAGSGMVGTNATGLLTLRPDFVRVGSGVYDDEMSESSSSCVVSDEKGSGWHYVATHIALIDALRALPLASATSTTTAPTPAPSSRPPRRRRRSTCWRYSNLGLERARRPHAATSPSPGGTRVWRRCGQFVARYITLQDFCLFGLKCSGARGVA